MSHSKVLEAQLDPNDLIKGIEIGSGSFGKVYKVTYKKDKTKCIAAKVVISGDYHQVEIEIHGIGIHHPTLIKFIGYSPVDFDGKNNYVIFMELAEKGSLEKIFDLNDKGMKPDEFDSTTLLLAFIIISRGMMILHRNNIIHRDLTARNIVFTNEYIAKIIDFGLAKLNASLLESNRNNRLYGTSEYMAPEIVNGHPYSKAADVYSFGVLMRKAITFFPDFNFINYDIFQKLVGECLDINPDRRPSFEEIYGLLKDFVINGNINDEDFDICRIQDYIQEIDVNETFYALKSQKGYFSYAFYGLSGIFTTGIALGAYEYGKKTAKKLAEEAAKKLAEETAKKAAESSGGIGTMILISSGYGAYKIGKKAIKLVSRKFPF